MNPATGRFITMDEYSGSIFDPVSLHKYLYANANPVMYSDPSGYMSLGEVTTTMAIQGVLCGTINAVFSAIVRDIFRNQAGLEEPPIGEAVFDFIKDFGIGFIFGFAGAMNSVIVSRVLAIAFSLFGGMSWYEAIECFKNGEIGWGNI